MQHQPTHDRTTPAAAAATDYDPAGERVVFRLMDGAGNTFIVADARGRAWADRWAENGAEFIRRCCGHEAGAGVDGMLLLGDVDGVDPAPPTAVPGYRMIYFNADGSRGEFCGNGARALALFAAELSGMAAEDPTGAAAGDGTARWSCTLLTDSGRVEAEVGPVTTDGDETTARVSLSLPPASLVGRDITVRAAGADWRGSLLEVGVPHFVVMLDSPDQLDAIALQEIGGELRRHAEFAPRGANINFVAPARAGDDEADVAVRTYERGVEAETLACGSGAVACSGVWSRRAGTTCGPASVAVRARSGDLIEVTGLWEGERWASLQMTGPARSKGTFSPPKVRNDANT